MLGLVNLHLVEDCTAAGVFRGKFLDMAFEMGFNLVFGLLEKAEAPAVTGKPGGRTDRK